MCLCMPVQEKYFTDIFKILNIYLKMYIISIDLSYLCNASQKTSNLSNEFVHVREKYLVIKFRDIKKKTFLISLVYLLNVMHS